MPKSFSFSLSFFLHIKWLYHIKIYMSTIKYSFIFSNCKLLSNTIAKLLKTPLKSSCDKNTKGIFSNYFIFGNIIFEIALFSNIFRKYFFVTLPRILSNNILSTFRFGKFYHFLKLPTVEFFSNFTPWFSFYNMIKWCCSRKLP